MTSNEPDVQAEPPAPWQPVPPADTAKPGDNRQQRIVAWLVLALVIVVIAVGTSPFWAPAIAYLLPWGASPPAAVREVTAGEVSAMNARINEQAAALQQLSALKSRLDADEVTLKDQAARLRALEARPASAVAMPAPAPAAENPESLSAIKALQDQFAKLAAGESATGDRIAKLESKITEAGASGRADRALLLALANLRIATEGAAPFAAELAAAQALAGDKTDVKPALAALGDNAKTGLPTLGMLAERFDRRVAPAILRARGETPDEDWWQQIKSRLEHLVVIRRIGPGSEPSDSTEAAVSRADAALKAGDLAGAVAALDKLTGARAAAAASWLAQAKQRIATEATLAKLWQAESARVAAASRGDKP